MSRLHPRRRSPRRVRVGREALCDPGVEPTLHDLQREAGDQRSEPTRESVTLAATWQCGHRTRGEADADRGQRMPADELGDVDRVLCLLDATIELVQTFDQARSRSAILRSSTRSGMGAPPAYGAIEEVSGLGSAMASRAASCVPARALRGRR